MSQSEKEKLEVLRLLGDLRRADAPSFIATMRGVELQLRTQVILFRLIGIKPSEVGGLAYIGSDGNILVTNYPEDQLFTIEDMGAEITKRISYRRIYADALAAFLILSIGITALYFWALYPFQSRIDADRGKETLNPAQSEVIETINPTPQKNCLPVLPGQRVIDVARELTDLKDRPPQEVLSQVQGHQLNTKGDLELCLNTPNSSGSPNPTKGIPFPRYTAPPIRWR